jgi:hypothetical protein
MSYDVEFNRDGYDQYQRLNDSHPWYMDAVDRFLRELGKSPMEYGRRNPNGGSIAVHHIVCGNSEIDLVVCYEYGQDEAHILITEIGIGWH